MPGTDQLAPRVGHHVSEPGHPLRHLGPVDGLQSPADWLQGSCPCRRSEAHASAALRAAATFGAVPRRGRPLRSGGRIQRLPLHVHPGQRSSELPW